MRAAIALMLLVLSGCATPVATSGAGLKSDTTAALIDQLQGLDHPLDDLDPNSAGQGFMADGRATMPGAALLGSTHSDGSVDQPQRPSADPAAREIVKRGAAAVPDLLNCLGDARPTKFIIKNDKNSPFLMVMFSDEYDLRHRIPGRPMGSIDDWQRVVGDYTVKLADVCYTLLGQIVDRRLSSVRYQPTGFEIINSPIERPDLAAKAKADWSGLTQDVLRNSLISDINDASYDGYRYEPPLRRLRFYFPQAYAGLTGVALKWKREFEDEEARGEE